jgi:aminopeptidase
MAPESVREALLRHGNDEQLSFLSPVTRVINEQATRTIGIMAPSNTRALSTIDPTRMAIAGKATEPLMANTMRRTAEGQLRWVGCAYPTQAGAQDAGMSLREYEDFVYGAGLLNEPDPVAAWQKLGERQSEIIAWLRDKKRVRIQGPGTDLTIGIAGRPCLTDDAHLNFPGGEIFTGPDEDVTEGIIQFNFPGFYAGREVTGVRLEYKGGRVSDASATGDQDFLQQMLDMDPGARVLGEFAFGTNPGIQRFTKNTLFDEKIGGTIHMALGRGYPESGSHNVSAIHWDMVYDLRGESEVTVDGELLLRNGEFQI